MTSKDNHSDFLWLRRLLTAIVVLLAVIAIELSALPGSLQPRAVAQVLPDSARQRVEMMSEMAKTTAAIDRILQHLRTQTIKVKVVGADKELESAPVPKAPTPPK